MNYEEKYKNAVTELYNYLKVYTNEPKDISINFETLFKIFPELEIYHITAIKNGVRDHMIKYFENLLKSDNIAKDNVEIYNMYLEYLNRMDEDNIQFKTPSVETETEDETDKIIFKVGDWVVKKDGTAFPNQKRYDLITRIDKEGRIWFDDDFWTRNDDLRYWTINDAKDGDILAIDVKDYQGLITSPTGESRFIDSNEIKNDFICIFKQCSNPISVKYGENNCYLIKSVKTHCYISVFGDFHLNNGYGQYENVGFHPANDEQCDLLLRALREHNYVWNDNEKKIIIDK